MRKLSISVRRQYERGAPDCALSDTLIRDLADYFGVLDKLLTKDAPLWYRGHSNLRYELIPTALRFASATARSSALSLLADFRRLAEIRIPKPPGPAEDLKWLQLAQHYGLVTRLLDWTENAAAALYFACSRPLEDGSVILLDPIQLNRNTSKQSRVFDAHADAALIQTYLGLTGIQKRRGLPTIAIHPVLNSERIALQRGAFTLHGSRAFALDRDQAPFLVLIPILAKHKAQLLDELDRIGICEMTLFPELDHICNHLIRKANLS